VVEHLSRAGFEVVVISARQVKSLRPLWQRGNKDASLDAFVLADALAHRAGRWHPVQPDSPETRPADVVRARQDLVTHRIAGAQPTPRRAATQLPRRHRTVPLLDNAIS